MELGNSFQNILDSALTFLGGGLSIEVFKYIVEKRKLKQYAEKSLNIVDGFDDISNIYSQMDKILETTSATRVMLFRGSNGGGLPMAGGEFYVKAIHQALSEEDGHNLVERYNNVLIDGHYANLLRDIVTHGSVKINVDAIPDCLLKKIYLTEGIKYSEVHYLVSKGLVDRKIKFEIFYLSIGKNDNEGFVNDNDKLNIEFGVNNIKKIFQKYRS